MAQTTVIADKVRGSLLCSDSEPCLMRVCLLKGAQDPLG